jgi:SAM-dependent methyltransferase
VTDQAFDEQPGVTPDGSPVLLYRRLRPADEPEIVRRLVRPQGSILELGAGAGRLTHALVALGYRVVAVDESAEMLSWIRGAETVRARIEELDLQRRFDCVLLASYLVNTSDDGQRRAFLVAARRHLAADGVVLLQHHPANWAETAEESRTERDGVALNLTELRVRPPHVSAVMVFEVDGQTYRQPFTARVFDRDELAAELSLAGLRLSEQINERWSVAELAGS